MTMASSHDDILCGICNEQEVTKFAEKWCPECDEGLCVDCEKHHRISKASRHHAVISINDYKALPTEISKIYHYCEVHERKFQMYCPHHDQPCCLHCISKHHDTCTGLVAIEDIVKNAKTSSLIETIEQSLRDSHRNIETIIKDKGHNLSKITEQREQVQDKIKQTRDQINTHFDNLERKLLNELDASEKTLTSRIGQLLGQLKEKSKIVKQLQHNLTAIKSHASDLQTFLGSKHLEKQAEQEDKYIRSLADDESLQTTNLKCTINEKIADIAAVSTFGSVIIEKGPTSVVVHSKKEKQAQIMSAMGMKSGSIDDIKLTLIRTFYLPKGKKETTVTGCAIFHNGNMAFADYYYNKRIVITDEYGILQSEISVSPSQPFDLTCLDNNSVAFTCYCDKTIKIINTASKATTKIITTTAECDGITNRQGTLIYCERSEGIILHQLGTKSSNTVVRQNISWCTYVASKENNIYHTNNESGTVTCYNLNGDKIWEFKDTSILNYACGVAVDKHLNVYVASHKNNSIVVISPDGKKSREIPNEKEGIKNPLGLAVDNKIGNLLVTCSKGAVLVYNVSYTGLNS